MTKDLNVMINHIDMGLQGNPLTPNTALCVVTLSISDACNRRCEWCPRGLWYEHKDTIPLFMSLETVEKICTQLGKEFVGRIGLSGFGEPTLCPHIKELVKTIATLCPKCEICIISNGAKMNEELIEMNEITSIVLSVYSQKEEKEFKDKFKNYHKVFYCDLYSAKRMFNFNNRAGNLLKLPKEPINTICYMPLYQLLIDTDGSIYSCPCDWEKKYSFGNIYKDNIYDVWTNKMSILRQKQINHERYDLPLCFKCDAHLETGKMFREFWKNYYDRKKEKQ